MSASFLIDRGLLLGVFLAQRDTSIHQFSSVPTALPYGIKNPNWWMIRSRYGTDVSQLPGWIPGYVGCRTCFRPQSYPQPYAWIVHLDMYPITFQCLQHILWYASYPLPHPSQSNTVRCCRCTYRTRKVLKCQIFRFSHYMPGSCFTMFSFSENQVTSLRIHSWWCLFAVLPPYHQGGEGALKCPHPSPGGAGS